MKNLVIAVFVFSTISLLAFGSGIAEPTHPNEVGLYANSTGTGATGTFVVGEAVEVYLVLTKPTDVVNGGAPFRVITGLELSLHFNPVPNNDLILLATEITPGSIDVGLIKDINTGFLDYVVGIPDWEAIEVVDEAATLVKFTFLNLRTDITEVTLHPTAGGQSVAGEMGFLGGQIPLPPYVLLAMYSVGGSHDAGVFKFNGEAVPVENQSFGSVKALYR